MNRKIVKEAIIILLLLLVIIFAMGILFYDSITVNADVIANADYETAEDVNEVLKEINESGGEDDIKQSSSSSLLKSYSVNAEDLSNFASGNYYESGKKDPFAESAEKINEHTTTTVQTGTATKNQTSNPVENAKKEDIVKPVVSDKKDDKTNKVTNEVAGYSETKTTNTLKNTVTSNKTNLVTNTSKEKEESQSSKGTFFESKNSK